MKKRQVLLNLHKNVLGQLPFLSNNDQNNTIDQYPESQKRQTIPGEPKAPDNTWRAKSARQYPESQKRQTIPGEPITLFFFLKIALKIKKRQVLLSLHKNVLEQLPFLSNNDQNNTH